MKEIQEKIKRDLEDIYWDNVFDKEEDKIKIVVEGLMTLLEWDFRLKIWWIFNEKAKKIFDFLKEKKRTCNWILTQADMYEIEAPIMDRDFFKKYFKELFNPKEYGYIFEDSKKIIELFEGGIEIKNK